MLKALCTRRCKVLAVLLVSSVAALSFFLYLSSSPIDDHPYFHYDLYAEEPVDPDQLCYIPRIHPFDPSILRYLSVPRPISCRESVPGLTYVDASGWLRINDTGVAESGYNLDGGDFLGSLLCTWRPVLRGGQDQSDDHSVVYGQEVTLTRKGAPLEGVEVVSVSCCNFAGVAIYEALHAHIRNVSSTHTKVMLTPRPKVNVLIFGLDSLSRQAFMRLLPNTYSYLTNTLSMHVFTAMNKVGDNTFPNLIAMLTGKEAYSPELPDPKLSFDDYPLIWKNFSKLGYATLWAEDFPDYGLFTFLAKGFRRPPTDHYLRPFWLAVQGSNLLRTSSHMCLGSTPRHVLQLDYVRRFVEKYRGIKPYFGFSFLAEISHEYMAQVSAGDSDFEGFFRFLHQGEHLNNTLLIVMSDHGHRFDAIRSTEVGHLEERLPFFAIRLPDSLTTTSDANGQSISNRLRVNRGRLTTPFDTFATLEDLLNYLSTGKPLGLADGGVTESSYGRTLFGSIPANRTCRVAGIPPHYCACKAEIPVDNKDPRVAVCVSIIMATLNQMLKHVQPPCAKLTPGGLIAAHLVITTPGEGEKRTSERLRITLSTFPSDAIFEATVELRSRKEAFSEPDGGGAVLGDVSRINKYGNQSNCIKHEILRKYCYCVSNDQIMTNA